jgi:hypothetical protein
MGFVDFTTEAGDLSASVLSTEWALYQSQLAPATLVIAEVKKNSRGLNLIAMSPVA